MAKRRPQTRKSLTDDSQQIAQELIQTREALQQSCQRFSALQRLAESLSEALDDEAMVKTLHEGLPTLIHADLVGIAKARHQRLWVWSSAHDREREARLRRYLRRRLGLIPSDGAEPQPRLRLVRQPHLYPVPTVIVDQVEHDGLGDTGCEVTLSLGSKDAGLLLFQRQTGGPFTKDERQLVQTIGSVLSLSFCKTQTHQNLQDMSLRDPLTGVLNREAFERAVTRELRVSLRYGVPACLLWLDLDYFTTVNEVLGHTTGDQVLKTAAEFIQATVRDSDVIGRIGGEAFAVILPHTDRVQASALAERLRGAIEQHQFVCGDGQVRGTTSIGLAAVPNAGIASVAEWLTVAESALRRAKSQGRNCVVSHMVRPPASAQAAVMSLAA